MKKTSNIDIKIGGNIKKYRIAAGLNRKELADELGITHQQLQKYEKGVNRISVSRMLDISKILKTSLVKLIEIDNSAEEEFTENKTIAEVIRLLNKIDDEKKLEAIKNLIKSF